MRIPRNLHDDTEISEEEGGKIQKKFLSLEVKLLQTGTLNVKIRRELGAAQNHIISVKISSRVRNTSQCTSAKFDTLLSQHCYPQQILTPTKTDTRAEFKKVNAILKKRN
jgi:hypothetical protein